MKKEKHISWDEILNRLSKIDKPEHKIYGVPKNGMILCAFLHHATIVPEPHLANLILDDIIDSGQTKEYYNKNLPGIPFFALFNKKGSNTDWFVFPWEAQHPAGVESVQQNLTRVLQYIGEDPTREGLKNTPNRIVRSWKELYAGYEQKPKDILTTFSADGYDQIILLKDIELYSMCEHHNLPFVGKAHVAYLPDPKGKIVGISKLARLIEIYARRMQIQERIGDQVTSAIMKHIKPLGAACVIEADHMCMRMRGVGKQHSKMVTSSLKGIFSTDTCAKTELMQLIK